MKKLILLTGFIITAFFLNAQTIASFQWAKRIGGAGYDEGKAVAVDAQGNVYTTGYFSGTVDFDPGVGTYTLSGISDIFVSKLNSSGAFVWAKQMGGPNGDVGFSIAVDALGNVYTTGLFQDSSDFDPGPASFKLFTVGSADAFVSKLDPSGNFVWAKQLGGSGNGTQGYGITVDSAGNVYTTGYFFGVADFDPGPAFYSFTTSILYGNVFVSKLNASGNFVWAKEWGGTSSTEQGNSIAVDNAGNVYTTGNFGNVTDFDPGPGSYTIASSGGLDIFISKLDNSGNLVWAKGIGGQTNDQSNSIKVDSYGNIYTSGLFTAIVDFDPGPSVYTLTPTYVGNGSAFISKLNSTGTFVWAKQITGTGSVGANSIDVDINKNVYTTGFFQNTVDLDPALSTYTINTYGVEDIFISKLDSLGNFAWGKQLGGGLQDIGNSIAVDFSGNVYTTGNFNGTADFDPGLANYNLTSAGYVEIFIQKMSQCTLPPQPLSINGLDSLCAGTSGQNYNVIPVNSATSYSWNLPGGWSGSSITNNIFAIPGSSGIFSVTATNNCGNSSIQTLSITVNSLPSINAITSTGLICRGQSATLTATGANTYTWNTTATNPSIIVSPTVTTLYTVNGTDGNGCTNFTTVTQSVSTCTGIQNLNSQNGNIKLYPNPSNSILNIELETLSPNIRIEICNSLGQIVLDGTLAEVRSAIDLQYLKNGIYFVKISEGNKIIFNSKLVKQ